jgi:hypothetical protein
MNKRLHMLLPLLLLLCTGGAFAQRLEPTVVAVAGGLSRTATFSVSWTIGQTAVETRTHRGGTITEGVQQPYLSVIPIGEHRIPFTLSMYPNPTVDAAIVSVAGADEDMTLVLYSLIGTPVLRHEVRAGERIVRLNMAPLSPGLYLLAALSPSGEQRALYKVVKAEL